MKLGMALAIGGMTGAGIVPIAGILAPAAQAEVEIAQTLPPVARINPTRPIQIRVINPGGAAVRCRLTQPATDERIVAPGDTVTFGSTRTSYLPTPIYFLAYPGDAEVGLSLDVFVSGNVVTVVVAEALSQVPGSTAMSIDAEGNIYTY